MNKVDLIDALKNETRISETIAKQVVELFFDEMSNALAKGDGVEIGGFGSPRPPPRECSSRGCGE